MSATVRAGQGPARAVPVRPAATALFLPVSERPLSKPPPDSECPSRSPDLPRARACRKRRICPASSRVRVAPAAPVEADKASASLEENSKLSFEFEDNGPCRSRRRTLSACQPHPVSKGRGRLREPERIASRQGRRIPTNRRAVGHPLAAILALRESLGCGRVGLSVGEGARAAGRWRFATQPVPDRRTARGGHGPVTVITVTVTVTVRSRSRSR